MSNSSSHSQAVELDEFGLPKANPMPVGPVRDTFLDKCKKEPLVPLFAAMTAGVLGYGLFSFKNSKVGASQKAMRLRVVAQGLTIAAMVGYLGVAGEGPIADLTSAIKAQLNSK